MHTEICDHIIGTTRTIGAAGAGVDGVAGAPADTAAGVPSGDAAPRPGGSPGPRPDAPGTAPDGGTSEAPQPDVSGTAQPAADATADAPADAPAPGDSPPAQGAMPTHEAFAQIVKRANRGDLQALAALRDVLDHNPEIWHRIGNLAAISEATLVDLIAGDDCLAQESLQRSIGEMKSKLSLPGAGYLDELAVERVVATWLQLQHSETGLTGSDAGTRPAAFWLKRQTQADKAYNAALKSLGTLRRLLPAAAVQTPQQATQANAAAPTAPAAGGKSAGSTISIGPYLDSTAASQADEKRAVGM